MPYSYVNALAMGFDSAVQAILSKVYRLSVLQSLAWYISCVPWHSVLVWLCFCTSAHVGHVGNNQSRAIPTLRCQETPTILYATPATQGSLVMGV